MFRREYLWSVVDVLIKSLKIWDQSKVEISNSIYLAFMKK